MKRKTAYFIKMYSLDYSIYFYYLQANWLIVVF